jgi:hypothetical protein
MAFDLSSAIPIRQRDDGLLEEDTFDLGSAVPVDENQQQNLTTTPIQHREGPVAAAPGASWDLSTPIQETGKLMQDILTTPMRLYNAFIPQPVDETKPRNAPLFPVPELQSRLMKEGIPNVINFLGEQLTMPRHMTASSFEGMVTGQNKDGTTRSVIESIKGAPRSESAFFSEGVSGDPSMADAAILMWAAVSSMKYTPVQGEPKKVASFGTPSGKKYDIQYTPIGYANVAEVNKQLGQQLEADLLKNAKDNIRNTVAENLYEYEQAINSGKGLGAHLSKDQKIDIILNEAAKNPSVASKIKDAAELRWQGKSGAVETTATVVTEPKPSLFKQLQDLNAKMGKSGSTAAPFMRRPVVGEIVNFKGKPGTIVEELGDRFKIRMAGEGTKQVVAFLKDMAPISQKLTEFFQTKSIPVITEKMPQQASVGQTKAILQAGGVSPSEMEMSGLDEFLKGKDVVNRDELITYLQENQPQVEETVLGNNSAKEQEIERQTFVNKMYRKYRQSYPNIEEMNRAQFEDVLEADEVEEWHRINMRPVKEAVKFAKWQEPGGAEYKEILLRKPVKSTTRYIYEGLDEADKEHYNIKTGMRGKIQGEGWKLDWNDLKGRIPKTTFNILTHIERIKGVTWHGGFILPYQIEGRVNKNAQNVVIDGVDNMGNEWQYVRRPGKMTGPGGTTVYIDGVRHGIGDDEVLGQTTVPDYEQPRIGGQTKRPVKVTKYLEKLYTGGHYAREAKNVFAHLRLNKRTTTKNEPVTFVEEFQSDQNLAARKEGIRKDFRDWIFAGRDELGRPVWYLEGTKWSISKTPTTNKYVLREKTAAGEAHAGTFETPEEAVNATGTVPFNPYVKNWLDISIKRALKEAVENGSKYLSWTTGKQQADRYNLSKQVNKVYSRRFTSPDGDKYEIGVQLPNGNIIHASSDPRLSNVSESGLEEVVGKDLAKKIIEHNEDIGEWSGVDLEIGGEWAKTLYDKQIPNMFKDLTKEDIENIDLGGLNKAPMYIREYAQEAYPFAVVDRSTEAIVKNFSTWDKAKAYIEEKSKRYTVVNSITNEPVMKDMAYSKEEAEAFAIRMRKQNKPEWQGQPQDWIVKPLSSTQPAIELTPAVKKMVLQGFPLFGKPMREVGVPGLEHKIQMFRMDEDVQVIDTRGNKRTLPAGEEYRTVPVKDDKGNIVPNKVELIDGKEITVFKGELQKLKGKIIGTQPQGEGKAIVPEIMPKIADMSLEQVNDEMIRVKSHIEDKVKEAMAQGMARTEAMRLQLQSPMSERLRALQFMKNKLINQQPMAGGITPGQRQIKRKEMMAEWNTPEVVAKLPKSSQEFIQKYIDEGKSLEEIAAELGESIEDVRKTEKWTFADMENASIDNEEVMRAGMEQAADEEYGQRKDILKKSLAGQLDPALKNEGEYSKLRLLPWLWAAEGQGIRPDVIASELAGKPEEGGGGFPIEETEADVIGLIESYFAKEIEARAQQVAANESKSYAKKMAKIPKGRKAKAPAAPQRTITGVGNGSTISTRDDIDYSERSQIFSDMPFTLLGNKAEVLSRLPENFKKMLRQGIKKVVDLWGGAKGYRVGLFKDLPSADYNLNELSDERYNYYKNVQDPASQEIMKKTLKDIVQQFTMIMKNAFDIPEGKDNKDFLDMLNTWLQMGLKKERYIFAREIIQEFGDRLMMEAQNDNFESPESSAKYYFLENTALFGISTDKGEYQWNQGVIRTTKGTSEIKDIIGKIQNFKQHLDAEMKRDAEMPLTQMNAWDRMDEITQDLRSGQLIPAETVILIDPQYLNPSAKAGTYSVGTSDTTWEGHKANLERHFLPLVRTGVKIIYTNNADQNLVDWMRKNKLPYNIEKSIGAVAERSGRDELISFINYGRDVLGPNTGTEQPVGSVQRAGETAAVEGQQYITPRVTGQSERFTGWLRQQELKAEQERAKQLLIDRINKIQEEKMLSGATVSRIRKALGIREFKNSDVPQIQKMVTYLESLKTGDKLLSERQVEVLNKLLGGVKDLEIMPKRLVIEAFGDKEDMLSGLITKLLPNEVFPAVDLKEGHPVVEKLINKSRDLISHAEEEVMRRDEQLNEMLKKAERSRKLSLKENIKRKIAPQNKEIFKALSGLPVNLTPEERAVVAYLKNFFAMVKRELGLEKYRKNYVTHLGQPLSEKILTKGILGAIRQILREQHETNIPTDIMLELDNIIGSEKFFRFALERKGGIDPTTNLRKIIHEYSQLFETKVALDQILPTGDTIMRNLLTGKNAMWLKKFMQNLKGRGLDHELRTGKAAPLIKIADTIVNMGYVWLLSFNFWSAAKNIVAGETNSLIYQDIISYLTGKQRLFSNPKRVYELAKEHGILEGTYADYAQMGLSKLKELTNLAMAGQQLGEYEIRGSMFAGELTEKEWETGKISKESLNKIKDKVAITQGIFSRVDSPLRMQTWYGRAIMQMNRWRVTNAMLARRIAEETKKEWSDGNFSGKATRQLAKMVVLYSIAAYFAWEAAKAGNKRAQKLFEAMQEPINNILQLPWALVDQVTDNPTINMVKMLLFSTATLMHYMFNLPMPNKIDINKGIEDIYIPAIQQFSDTSGRASSSSRRTSTVTHR